MGFNPVDLALGNISAVNASNDKLRKENAELRELVRGLMHCPVDLYHCETCEHAEVTPKSVTGNWDKYDCKLRARAQELGAI